MRSGVSPQAIALNSTSTKSCSPAGKLSGNSGTNAAETWRMPLAFAAVIASGRVGLEPCLNFATGGSLPSGAAQAEDGVTETI